MNLPSSVLSRIWQTVRTIASSETLEYERTSTPDTQKVSILRLMVGGEELGSEPEEKLAKPTEKVSLFNLLFKPEKCEEWPPDTHHSFSVIEWLFKNESLDDCNQIHSERDRRDRPS